MLVAGVTLTTSNIGNGRAKYVSAIDIYDKSCPSIDVFKGCNLLALVEAMQDQFSREPPVYAKPKNRGPVRPQSSQSESLNQPPAAKSGAHQSTPSPTIPNDRPVLPPKPSSSTHPAIRARSQSIPTSPNASVRSPLPQNVCFSFILRRNCD